MASMRERIAGLDALIDSCFAGSGIPGIAVGIVHGGRLEHVRCLGHANIGAGTPVNQGTAFRLASISKTFTAVGLLQLWESGRFELDEPVNNHIQSGRVVVKEGWPDVTFTHLLTHQAGIGEITQKRDLLKPGFGLLVKGRDTPVPPLRTVHERPLRPEVAAGTKYAYSNIGVSLLGYVIEQLSGEPFRDYMVKHVLDPIGMAHSEFLPTSRIGDSEATGYKRSLGRLVPATYYQNIIAPAGNLISSLDDMARYAAMLLAKGSLPDGTRMLKASTVDLAFSPHYWASEALKDDASIGLCFHLCRVNGVRVVEHGGATSGFTSAMSLVPSEDLAVLVFCNKDEIFGARRTQEIKHRILVALLGGDRERMSGVSGRPVANENAAGFYGPLPGVLTNTRILGYYGGDFKMSTRGSSLVLSSFYGSRRKGVELVAAGERNHFLVSNPKKPDARKEHLALIEDGQGHVTGLALEHFKLRRNRFANTLRFKASLVCIAVVVAICVVVIIALLPAFGCPAGTP
ncbi:MAG: beta-lactamase family protein [Candidatus Lokiarchaeota archaeon]|nr:beta-lactamase family protein [Candidatus Lokiarchaeota archaeon]